MTQRSVVVVSVPHQLQGKGFVGYVSDPTYEAWLRSEIQKGVDFVFEEAAGRAPSTAKDIAEELIGSDRYRDMDPSPQERKELLIGKCGGGEPADPVHSRDVVEWTIPEENRKREEIWLERLSGQGFRRGLVICGLAHALSFSFRVINAGIKVDKTYCYIPYCRICDASRRSAGSQ